MPRVWTYVGGQEWRCQTFRQIGLEYRVWSEGCENIDHNAMSEQCETIRQTIESVLNQTYQDIEYIIVDGASTDGTLEIIQEYEDQFQGRMQYVSEPDNGIYDAMNKGIRMSHGNVIGIINSDDFYEGGCCG